MSQSEIDDVLLSLSSSLPPASRDEFINAVISALAAYPVEARGGGLAFRLASSLQKDFLGPLRVTGQPQHFNKCAPEHALHRGREI
jgi:hypothetical protein